MMYSRPFFFIFFVALLFFAHFSSALSVETISLGEEKSTRTLYVEGKLYAMSEGSKNLIIIDIATHTIKNTIKLGQVPVFGTVANKKLYLQHTDNRSVTVFDAVTDKYIKSIYTQLGPIFGIVDTGNLFVLNQVSNSMTVIDLSIDLPESHTKIDDDYGEPESLFLYGSKIFIMSTKNAKVTIFNKFNNVVTKRISVPSNPVKAVRVDATVYILHRDTPLISVIDSSREKLTDIITLPYLADDIILANNHLYILHKEANKVSIIDAKSPTIKKTISTTLSVGERPISATLLGENLYVNNSGGNSVSVIDTTTNTVTKTLSVNEGPLSSIAIGSRLYINSPESNSISVLYTGLPVLNGLTSQSANRAYGPGEKIDIRAVFDQQIKPESTMTITLNNGSQIILSQADKNMLSGVYIVEESQVVEDLTATAIISAKIQGISDTESSDYTLRAGKNIGNYKNISLKKEREISKSLCKNAGYYRKCTTLAGATNLIEYQKNLLCEGIIAEYQTRRTTKRITRLDVLSMAVSMLRVPLDEVREYRGEFQDITEPMKPLMQIALDRGLIINTPLFEPTKPITRIEVYTLLMKGVCLVPQPLPNQNWTQAVYDIAYKNGITNITLSRFKPSQIITKKEAFVIASKLADWADTTGGCRPQVCQ